MKLYREVLIESAEQAEALPVGTVAVFAQHGTPSTTAIKLAGPLPGWWLGDERVLPWEVRGWSALVPIEADEEILHQDTFDTSEQLRRYTTPWQRFTALKEGA